MSPATIRASLGLALAAVAASVAAAPVTYEIDPSHTDVIAQWNHLGFSNPTLHFGQVEGRIVYDAENVAASSVEVTAHAPAAPGGGGQTTVGQAGVFTSTGIAG